MVFGCLLFSNLANAQHKADSIQVAVAPNYNNVGKFHRFLFGENYRKTWAAPVKIRVFNIQQEKGGLKIVKLGGGMQTRSLRLEDNAGRQYVLRTLQKYPERALPANLKETIAKDILQDQVTTANPFAALTVPPLANALNIPHMNPEAVYVADDPGLGEYRKDFANQVFLFEERIPDESEKSVNTDKLIKNLQKDNDELIDQKIVLRARLLDMLLGDWDRHEDQWRWDKTKTGKQVLYTPIPRDRDQVYYQTSGIFPWIVSHQWLKSKFQPYKDEIRDINGWNFNARYFDRSFLNALSQQDWEEQIAYVQQHLPDSLVYRAMKRMPPSVYEISGKQLAETFIQRRNRLAKQAIDYYQFISIYVDIPASDKHEKLVLDYRENGEIAVTIYKTKKEGNVEGIIYQRTFVPQVTKEIRLYGYGGNNAFEVKGQQKSNIKVRLIGGQDSDSYQIDNDFANANKLLIYDDKGSKNNLPNKKLATLRLSNDTAVYNYNRKSFAYDRFEIVVLPEYNNDNGVSVNFGFRDTKHGFRKEPYAFKHELIANYSIPRKSFSIGYEADWKKLIGNYDLNIKASSQGPNNVGNFFGVGNNSQFMAYLPDDDGEFDNDQDDKIPFFRNRYDLVDADVSLKRRFGNFELSAGISNQFYNSAYSNNANKFLGLYQSTFPGENVFGTKWYTGLKFMAVYDTRNNPLMPTKGLYWQATLRGLQQLNENHLRSGTFHTDFTAYLNPDGHGSFVMANRSGVAASAGDPAFFQMVKLGGSVNLRGFYRGRFTGTSLAFNNLELRLKVLDFNSYLFPGKLGLIGFHDIGRVWSKGVQSNTWHNGYGGGIFFSPADLLLLQAVVGTSKESTMTYVGMGFRF